MSKKISVALFTPFHPNIGGGSVNLRSAIERFEQVDVRWFYLGSGDSSFPNTTCVGRPLIGGAVYRDLFVTPLLWGGWRSPEVRHIATVIANPKPDVCWTLAVNEGVLVGLDLLRMARSPLHVSVQDDQADAICPRSRRYRWLRPLVARTWLRLMRAVRDADVTSDGMQRYYRERYGIDTWVFHPTVEALPELPLHERAGDIWTVGHIGTIYSAAEFLGFVRGLSEAAASVGKMLRMIMVGESTIPRETILSLMPPGAVLEKIDALAEKEAVLLLGRCDFVYAMYPFEDRSRVFRCTSFPTKLSTYMQAQRPIFAHTPGDSTLADFVLKHGLGLVCASPRPHEITQHVARIQMMDIPRERFEAAREKEYGTHNARRLEQCLVDLAAEKR